MHLALGLRRGLVGHRLRGLSCRGIRLRRGSGWSRAAKVAPGSPGGVKAELLHGSASRRLNGRDRRAGSNKALHSGADHHCLHTRLAPWPCLGCGASRGLREGACRPAAAPKATGGAGLEGNGIRACPPRSRAGRESCGCAWASLRAERLGLHCRAWGLRGLGLGVSGLGLRL